MVVPGSMPKMMRSFANLIRSFVVMDTSQHKTKQYLIAVAKVFIVVAAVYFIYAKLTGEKALNPDHLFQLWQWQNAPLLILLGLFTIANRFLEILKWHNLAQVLRPTRLAQATEQVLAALTAGIFTPNGLGEYGAKALYFPKEMAKSVVLLNLVCNGIQMVISILFGLIGLSYLNWVYRVISWWQYSLLLTGIAAVGYALFRAKDLRIQGQTLGYYLTEITELPRKIHSKNALLGIGRYAIFSHQYLILFALFGVEVPYLTLLATTATVYLIASSLPTFQFLDFAVKGSVAVFFYSLVGVNEWIAILVSTCIWLLNIVFPVSIGAFYVLKFKNQW